MTQNQTNPTFTTGLEAIRFMADEVLALKTEGSPLTNHFVGTSISPGEVMSDIQEIPDLRGLLLEEGKSLLDPNARRVNGIQHDLIIGEVEPNVVVLKAWGWDYDCPDSDAGENEIPNWSRQLDVIFQYTNGYNSAHHKASAQAIVDEVTGSGAWLSRQIKDLTDQEMGSGNQGHEQRDFDAPDESIIAFVGICKAMFDTRTIS